MASQTVAFVPGVQVARARLGEGPLSGLTFAAKDVFSVRGHRSSAGHPQFASSHPPAEADSPVVARLREAGADLLGVTVLDELAYSLVGQNPHYGTPVNPRAPGHVCGGSSCGSAAAVAGCLCDFALGTDTAGSVRVPASFCGLFGLRPSHGAISTEGVVPLAPSFDTVGFFARDPHVFENVASVLLADLGPALGSHPEPRTASHAPITRVLIADDALALCDAGVTELLDHLLLRACSLLSLPVERVKLAPDGFAPLVAAQRRLSSREVYRAHRAWLDSVHPTFSPAIQQRFDSARELYESGESAQEDAQVRAALRDQLRELLTPGTLLFMPPTASVAPRLDASDEALARFRAQTLSLTCVASLAGVPQLVVPARELSGAPLGLSFLAAEGMDSWLVGMASTWDRVLSG